MEEDKTDDAFGCACLTTILFIILLVWIVFCAIHGFSDKMTNYSLAFLLLLMIYKWRKYSNMKREKKEEQEKEIEVQKVIENKKSKFDWWYARMSGFISRLSVNKDFESLQNSLEGWKIDEASFGYMGNKRARSFKSKLLLALVYDTAVNLRECDDPLFLDEYPSKMLEKIIYDAFNVNVKAEKEHLDKKMAESNSIYLVSQPNIEHILDCIMKAFEEIFTTESPLVIFSLLEDFDEKLRRQYAKLQCEFACLVIDANNTHTCDIPWIGKLINMQDSAITAHSGNTVDQNRPKVDKTQDGIQKLNSLVGLDNVKQEIKDLASLIQLNKMRAEKGLSPLSITYHCVFTGNPGTGKTTVARIFAKILKELGILRKGQLIETDRSGLVAEYVGQTAVKTNKVIDSALDGVLFIDEAYSLCQSSAEDFGKEAISTLLKRMEDDRSRLVVILAGYEDEMQKFVASNPGLSSRFTRYIDFPDYVVDDLLKIFTDRLKKYKLEIEPSALESVRERLSRLKESTPNFGNARAVRNLFDEVVKNQARRLSKERGNITLITKADCQ